MLLAAAGIAGGPGTSSVTPGWVRVEGDRIAEVGTGPRPGRAEDLGDAVLAPGFVDLQINGLGTVDFAAADPQAIAAALDRITESGCTTCLPTLVTAPRSRYAAMLDAIAAARDVAGAAERCAAAGVHLEGPFLGGAPGAHPVEHVRAVDRAELDATLDRHRDLVRIVTLAPEADPTLEATRSLVARGIVAAVGHTAAGFDAVVAMVDAGARLVTHVFNGMAPFHHRAPGAVGVALGDPRVAASIIADLVHVHPAALRIAIAAQPRTVLVTDAVATGAGSAASVRLAAGGDGAARLADGTLAGSTLTMDAAVRNVVTVGIGLDRAIAMASTIPAAVIGLVDRGRIAPELRADLVALDRATLAVRGVWVAGRRVR